MKRWFVLCATIMLAGCSGPAADERPVMVERQHAHYHVHGPDIEHGHQHDNFPAGGHTHEHDTH